MVVEVTRYEDMSPDGRLTLIKQSDGDIIVCVKEGGDDTVECAVEFCASGGHSYKTLQALRALMIAMEEDNHEDGY